MERIKDYVEELRRKPVHVRERLSLLGAVAITGIVSLGYLAALTSSGRLALDFRAPSGGFAASKQESFSRLLGAAGAAGSFGSEGELTVVESKSSSTFEVPDTGSATAIPF